MTTQQADLQEQEALRKQAAEDLRKQAISDEAQAQGEMIAHEALRKLTQEVVERAAQTYLTGKIGFKTMAERDTFSRSLHDTFKRIVNREIPS